MVCGCDCVCNGVWMCVYLSRCVHVSVFVRVCGCVCVSQGLWM